MHARLRAHTHTKNGEENNNHNNNTHISKLQLLSDLGAAYGVTSRRESSAMADRSLGSGLPVRLADLD